MRSLMNGLMSLPQEWTSHKRISLAILSCDLCYKMMQQDAFTRWDPLTFDSPPVGQTSIVYILPSLWYSVPSAEKGISQSASQTIRLFSYSLLDLTGWITLSWSLSTFPYLLLLRSRQRYAEEWRHWPMVLFSTRKDFFFQSGRNCPCIILSPFIHHSY